MYFIKEYKEDKEERGVFATTFATGNENMRKRRWSCNKKERREMREINNFLEIEKKKILKIL